MSNRAVLDVQIYPTFSPCGSTDSHPLFLAADGIHGIVNIDFDTPISALDSTNVIKICLYGINLRWRFTMDRIDKVTGTVHIKIPQTGTTGQNKALLYSTLNHRVCTIFNSVLATG